MQGRSWFSFRGLVVTLICLLFAGSAHAESDADKSRVHFKNGIELARAGRYKEARDEFLAAHKLYPHDSILLNLGIARSRVGDYVEAEEDLMRYLSDYAAATPEEEGSARAALADVRGHVGTLRLRVTPAGARVRIDDRMVALPPGESAEVRVLVGERVVSAEADSFVPMRERITVGTNRVETIEIKLEPVSARERAARNIELPSAGMLLIGVSVAGLGLGTYSGISALDLASQYKKTDDAGTHDAGVRFRTMADVSFGVALVCAGVGAYLIFGKSPQASIARAPLPNGIGQDGALHF